MESLEDTSVPPSVMLDFLGALIGVKITDLVRYSWWPADEVAGECNIGSEQAFALTAGPLAIFFEDGSVLGLGSDPSMNSVIVWDEGARWYTSNDTLDQDDELFPISAKDDYYAAPFWGGSDWKCFGSANCSKAHSNEC